MSYSPFKIVNSYEGEYTLMQATPDDTKAGTSWRSVFVINAMSEQAARTIMAERIYRMVFNSPLS